MTLQKLALPLSVLVHVNLIVFGLIWSTSSSSPVIGDTRIKIRWSDSRPTLTAGATSPATTPPAFSAPPTEATRKLPQPAVKVPTAALPSSPVKISTPQPWPVPVQSATEEPDLDSLLIPEPAAVSPTLTGTDGPEAVTWTGEAQTRVQAFPDFRLSLPNLPQKALTIRVKFQVSAAGGPAEVVEFDPTGDAAFDSDLSHYLRQIIFSPRLSGQAETLSLDLNLRKGRPQ